MQLEGKVALVTGAAGGIGRALVQRLEREGAVAGGADLHGADLIADVTDPAAVATMIWETENAHGVNIASSAGLGFGPYEGRRSTRRPRRVSSV